MSDLAEVPKHAVPAPFYPAGLTLSPQALELLARLFAPESNLQLPVAVAERVIEIRAWLQAQAKR